MRKPGERQDGYVAAGDTRIYYQCIGKGMPVVMLHGNRQNQQVFGGILRYFTQDYQVILIDSRGQGLTGIGKTTLDFSLLAEDVLRVLAHLHIRKAVIIGFSDGANTALQMALEYPGRVRGLVLISGNIRPSGLKVMFRKFIIYHYRILQIVEPLSKRIHRQVELSSLMAVNPKVDVARLKTMHAPVLILAGEHDVVERQHTLAIADAIPHSEVHLIKGAHHMSLFHRPEEYIGWIRPFLESVSSG